VKLGIREHWDKEDGSLQTSLRSLKDLAGHEVVIEPEWPLLLVELDKYYPDKTNLVAIAAGCVETWCKSMTELLEDEAHEEWTDTLLERVKSWSQIRLFLEVAKDDQASTSWSDQRTAFVINLPKKAVYAPAEFFPLFRGALLSCFDERKQTPPRRDAAGAADDWADVAVDQSTGTPAVVETGLPARQAAGQAGSTGAYKVDFLTSVGSLPRPDELFLRPPFHLVVHDMGRQKVEVHGSHSPSLQLLADYLKRWCRTNHHDTRNPPAVAVVLEQAPWGIGMMYDRLVITTEETRYTKQFTLNPCAVLAMVESVLGYERVSVHPGQWTFRRDQEFK